jgi:hypothetical protein
VGITPRELVHLRQGILNNAAERALRAVALSRKNYLFADAGRGSEQAAAIYSLMATTKFNGLDPEAYLRTVLEHLRVGEDYSDVFGQGGLV